MGDFAESAVKQVNQPITSISASFEDRCDTCEESPQLSAELISFTRFHEYALLPLLRSFPEMLIISTDLTCLLSKICNSSMELWK